MLKSKALKHISWRAEELCLGSTRSGRFGPAYPPLPTVAPPTRHAALPQVTQTDQASSAAARAPAPTRVPSARESVERLETCRAELSVNRGQISLRPHDPPDHRLRRTFP